MTTPTSSAITFTLGDLLVENHHLLAEKNAEITRLRAEMKQEAAQHDACHEAWNVTRESYSRRFAQLEERIRALSRMNENQRQSIEAYQAQVNELKARIEVPCPPEPSTPASTAPVLPMIELRFEPNQFTPEMVERNYLNDAARLVRLITGLGLADTISLVEGASVFRTHAAWQYMWIRKHAASRSGINGDTICVNNALCVLRQGLTASDFTVIPGLRFTITEV